MFIIIGLDACEANPPKKEPRKINLAKAGNLAGSNGNVGEYGWDRWTGKYMAVDPKEGLIFLYFIQRVDSGTTFITRKLNSMAYGLI